MHQGLFTLEQTHTHIHIEIEKQYNVFTHYSMELGIVNALYFCARLVPTARAIWKRTHFIYYSSFVMFYL